MVKKYIGMKGINKDGCLMKIIEYNSANDVVVEFQDQYKQKVHTHLCRFKSGDVKNPYSISVYGIGILGAKYSTIDGNGNTLKEYSAWKEMMSRCYSKSYEGKRERYKDVLICEEWLLYENFYEWLHSQENFDKWLNGNGWEVDKDILIKGNKVYSPKACCLVPGYINVLFTKRNKLRGEFPIGVTKSKNSFRARCNNPITKKQEYLGSYSSEVDAFKAYKKRKETIIKLIAEKEYKECNIIKKCYDAMMDYQVEITD